VHKKIYGPTRIGERGYRDILIYNIEDHGLNACVRFYGPNGPTPQPSVNGNATFIPGSFAFPNGITEKYTIVNDDFHPKKCAPRP